MQAITLLQQLLINSANKFPHKNALSIGKNKFTYACLLRNATLFANRLKENGLKRGDRVVVCATNSVHVIVAFWGTLMADGIISLIAPDLEEEKILYILKDSGASAFVDLRKVSAFTLDFETDALPEISFKNNELDLASIIYTSGSTGEPKGVMLTHRNMLTAASSINQYLDHSDRDVILSALPMSFDYGLYQMIMAFSVGATLVLEVDALFPAHILRKIEIEKVTVLPCVPTLFTLLTEHGRRFKYDYSTLRAVTNTGAALTHKNIKEISEIFPNAKIFSMYGLTECKRCTYLPPHAIMQKPDSVGIAIPNTELWIVDEAGQKVGPNIVGQLVIRGATVMRGYWNKPEETSKKLKEGPIPGEKVLYTGDYALQDEDGYLYFKGRMDEVLKFKGMKVSPIEMESTLSRLENVREVAVLGILDNSDDLMLVICLSASSNISDENLKAQVREALPRSLHPSHILIMKKLPKNTNGKINKRILKVEMKKLLCSENIENIA